MRHRTSNRILTSVISMVTVLPMTVVSAAAGPSGSGPREGPGQAGVEARLSTMTLPEKVGQMFVTYAYGPNPNRPDPRNRQEFGVDTPAQVVQRYHLGGIIHFDWTDSLHDPHQIAELSNGLQHAATTSGAGIPLLISTDQEQGSVTRVGPPATQFPGNMALGATRDPEAARQAAAVTGREMRAMGLNQNFAPDADVNVNPANPVIGVRSFSSDPDLAAQLTAAQVRGFQDAGAPDGTVSAAAKHFPGHGDTNQDSHTSLPVVQHNREQWEKLDAPPFRSAIAAGTDAVMSAHIVVPNLEPSGEPATLSPAVLTGMLRKELGYRGVIITDSLKMQGVRQKHSDAELPVLAIQAGADQMLMPMHLDVAIDSVLRAVRSGRISEQRIDDSVRRILRMKQRRALFEHPFVDTSKVDAVVGSPQHQAVARRVNDHSITALRNDADLLPLQQPPARALVTGAGSAPVQALADAIGSHGPRTTSLPTGDTPSDADIAKAVEAAKHNGLAVVLTNAAWKPEHAQQLKLLRALHDTGVPLVSVAVKDPYDAAYAEQARTWLATYSTTPGSMRSLADVLFGDVRPTGKLPVAIPDPKHPGTDRYPYGHGLTW